MRILVVGAGPTGLSAAWRLAERGHDNWLLVEGDDHPGGLATSIRDDAGFTWDLGGHVLFSHYRYFDALMNTALGDAWIEHQREAWVWMRERWVPYPFQNNIWRLPPDDLLRCLVGLVALQQREATTSPPAHFAEWLQRAFGDGLCDVFMYPYNRKVWAYTPDKMGVGWMGERVATVDFVRILGNLVNQRDEVSWGPNATFRFPKFGGTGAIWDALAARLPAGQLSLGRRLVRVDSAAREAHFSDGTSERYDRLLSSIPLQQLLRLLSDRPELTARAGEFVYSSSHVVGVGFTGQAPSSLATKCWMYFPEPETPFYRVTVFSNYSPHNVALPGTQWSLMAEVSESPDKPVDLARVVDETVAGFKRVGFIDDTTEIVTTWHRRMEYGYPTPWLLRDEVLDAVLPALEACGIYSRGRFGAWKYEVSNQDHSAMQGVEAIDHFLAGIPETTVHGTMGREPPPL